MKNALNVCLVLFLPFFAGIQQVRAQGTAVDGTVVSDQNDPLAGVSIVETGTANGVITDIDGNFSLTLRKTPSNLTFSYIGFVTKTVAVNSSSKNLAIVLDEDSKQLDEVVVIGYGTQKKASLTGSVVAINSEALMTTKNTNLQNVLTGKLPGLRVIQSTSEPGQFTNQFDIRGLGSPLFVVDGVPRGDFARLDPNDIESISILKDASAAIYGVRAANGVVLITTKTGSRQKSSIEYSGYYGIQMPAELLRPANARDRAVVFNETTMRSFTAPTKAYNDQYFEDLKNGRMPDTDWYDEIMRETAPQQQHNISIKGGNDRIDYFINGGYGNQGSFWKTNSNNYERYNFRANINTTIIDGLKASVKLNFITDETKRQRSSSIDIFKLLWTSRPNDPVYANNTAPYYYHPTGEGMLNVVPLIHPELSGEVSEKKSLLQSNMSLNYRIPFIKGLSTNFMFSYDKTFNDNSNFRKEFNEYSNKEANDSYSVYTRNAQTQLTRAFSTNYSTLWNWSLNYENYFADRHHVNALLLYEESYNQGYNFSAMRYFSIPVPYLFAGDDEGQVGTGSGLSENANKALIGRLNYDFSSKYLIEFSFRYDGSSKFPEGKQWGFFPAIQLGYRISEESFFKNHVSSVSNLKIRGSWGKLGDDGAAQFQFVEGFDYPATGGQFNYQRMPAGYVFGNTFVNGIGFRNAPNPDLTWYTSDMKNAGIDVDFLKGTAGFSVDFFQRDRDGLLANPVTEAPLTFGTGFSQANLNRDRTGGFEIELRHHYRVNRDFSYHATGFVSMTRSMITKWNQIPRSNSYDNWRNNNVNRYQDVWFGYGANGVYESWNQITNSIYSGIATLPGDPVYVDWNEDGVIDGDDMYPIATSTNPGADWAGKRNYPLMNFALTLGGQYKWFDFNVQLQGSAMSYVTYGEHLAIPLYGDHNLLNHLLDRWHPENPDIDPYDPSAQWISGRYPYGKTRADINSEFSIQNGAYLRLKNMELGFTVPKNTVVEKLKVSGLRLFVNTYNLFTLTGVIAVDPEKPMDGYGYMYPLNRTFNFGGSLIF
jgi:TonB-linked SusC/RagA family outer membrane protein